MVNHIHSLESSLINLSTTLHQSSLSIFNSKNSSSLPPSLLISSWLRLKVLGSGSYGVVYLATPQNPLLRMYLPTVAIKTTTINLSYSLEKEKFILKYFYNCPEIITCYGGCLAFQKGIFVYELVLEYASGGCLSDFIKKSKGGYMLEKHARECARMILKGLRCLHAAKIVHCDLKPENILVVCSKTGAIKLKIADFGLTKLPWEGEKVRRSRGLFKGTAIYMSPESILKGKVETCLDIWSLGCIMIEMMTGQCPWKGLNLEDLAYKLVCTNETPRFPDNMSELGKDFLRKCFERGPKQRWSASMLLNTHPYFLI